MYQGIGLQVGVGLNGPLLIAFQLQLIEKDQHLVVQPLSEGYPLPIYCAKLGLSAKVLSRRCLTESSNYSISV